MKDNKKQLILTAAIKVFARKSYQFATIEAIAREAGVSKGLIHFYFENKFDLLLSVILYFFRTINELNEQKLADCSDPVEQLKTVFRTIQEVMCRDRKNLYWGHILKEGMPGTENVKSPDLKQKLKEIDRANLHLQKIIDDIIVRGQAQGTIDPALSPPVIRQILGGSSQRLFYGLTLQLQIKRDMGYKEKDVLLAMDVLIEKFRACKK